MVQAKLMKKEKQQDYGNEPEKIRNSEFYKEEYVHGFVDKWDELIDWNARAKGEGSFFIEELRKRGKNAFWM